MPSLNMGVFSSADSVWSTDRHVSAIDGAARALRFAGVTNGHALAGLGAYMLADAVKPTIVVIRVPREKAALLQLLLDAFRVMQVGGRCLIAGATNEGVKTAARLMQELFGNSVVAGRESGHRIVVATKRGDGPADMSSFMDPLLDADKFKEVDVTLRGFRFTMSTRPGVFSWEHIDEATSILAEVIQIPEGASVLDIGCGAGALGVVAARLSGSGDVCMVDADVEAVRCARRTADNAGVGTARVLTSDVASAVIDERFDVAITNPPFHSGRATDLDLPGRFIRDAWTVIRPGGALFLVANRTLPYEGMIKTTFGNVACAHDGGRFKVLAATRRA